MHPKREFLRFSLFSKRKSEKLHNLKVKFITLILISILYRRVYVGSSEEPMLQIAPKITKSVPNF